MNQNIELINRLVLAQRLSLPDEIHTNDTETSLKLLQHFSISVYNGMQPDERVMKAIAETFGKYLCNHQIVGKPEKYKTLDDVFNLKPKKKVGHPVKQSVNRSTRKIFLGVMSNYRLAAKSRGESPTLIESAEWVLSNWKVNGEYLDLDAATLERYYKEIGGDAFFISEANELEKLLESD